MKKALVKLQANCNMTSTVFSERGCAISTPSSVATGSKGPNKPDTTTNDMRKSLPLSSSKLTPHSASANAPNTNSNKVTMK
jgi:hypothetical protein